MEWESDYVDLRFQFLSEEDHADLFARYPSVPRNAEQGCPTCKGTRKVRWGDGEKDCDCERQVRLHKLYLVAGIERLYQRLTWDDFEGDPAALEGAVEYLKAHKKMVEAGIGIILHGNYGTGKTLLATLMAKEFVKLGYSVYFTTFPEMIELFTKSWGSDSDRSRFERKIVTSEILVLDDVGKEFKTKSNLAESTFDYILRQRVVSLHPTIITTNMDPDGDMKQGYGGAIFSLLHERAIVTKMEGTDWRSQARARTMAELQNETQRPIF